MGANVAREIIVISKRTGEKSVYPCAEAAARALGMCRPTIIRCITGKTKKPRHPYIFRYGALNPWVHGADKRRAVVRIDPVTGEETVYESIAEAARQNGRETWSIGCVLRGKYKTTGGFFWRYADTKEGDKK